jgi:tRNA1Val (adenine37-N6)-methyltransferase
MTGRLKNTFQFKQFAIQHDKSVHKVGTDGVLLGAWADISNAKRVLDIGTGSGVISLMIAQRSSNDTIIEAIDISEAECNQAKENVFRSPWPEKVNIIHRSLQEHKNEVYDLIISNPPFFINSFKPPSGERMRVRHTESLAPKDLLFHSKRLLKQSGKLCLVLPFIEGKQLVEIAKQYDFYCTKVCEFQSRSHKPVERLLLQFEFYPSSQVNEKLVLYSENDKWSDAYISLTKEFYLNI